MFSNLNFKTDILPFLVATLGEFAALFFWLQLADDNQPLAATIVLWSGFLVERTAVVLWLRFVYQAAEEQVPQPPIIEVALALFVITLTEIVIWVVWLNISTSSGYGLGFVFVALALLLQHSVEAGILRRTRFIPYLTDSKTILFTLAEAVGATLWLYLARNELLLLGGVALLLGLSIEHVIQGATLKPEPRTLQPGVTGSG